MEDTSDYTVIDNINPQSDVVVLDKEDDCFVVAKMAPIKSQMEGGVRQLYWNRIRRNMSLALSVKPNIRRGKKNNGTSSRYGCSGLRKEPLTSGILGEYAYKKGTSQLLIDHVNEMITGLVRKMEKIGNILVSQMPEMNHYLKWKDMLDLPSVSGMKDGIAVQFSAGKGYWSPAHTDDDWMHTYLSVLSSKSTHHNEIIYYFCYPEYNIKIPIKSGEVIVFNPLKIHCCTNSLYDDSFISLAYVSKKSVMTAAIWKDIHNSK